MGRCVPAPPGEVRAWTLELDGWTPPSLNQLLNRHWARASRLKKAAEWRIYAACLLANVPNARGRRRVSITVNVTNKSHMLDPDNIPKSILDGLRKAGALMDDRAEFCCLGLVQSLKAGRKGTVIVIEEMEDAP